jgi:glycosyltransferase involved in cell wall biosynthesis
MASLENNIDVVIPVYRVDRFLNQAIQSALLQEDVFTRVIVVDAGNEIPISLNAEQLASGRLNLVRSEKRLTAGAARNLGVRHTKAPVLGFLDADDIWPLSRSKELLELLQRTNSDIATGMVADFRDGPGSENLVINDFPQVAFLAGGSLLTRTAWELIGPFDENLRAGEYIDFHNRAVRMSLKESFVETIALSRRIHVESSTVRESKYRSDYIKVVRRWMNQKD